jgi:hypothetical protein
VSAEKESSISIIAFGQPDQKELDDTAEDLSILSLILSRKLEQAFATSANAGQYKLGIPMLLQPRGHMVEASYVKGFGAILNLRVRFPLVPATAGKIPAQNEQPQTEWEAARSALARAEGGQSAWEPTRGDEAENYDGRVVDLLKRRVVEALRNASNLRHLTPEDWIIVNITGTGTSSARIPGGQPGATVDVSTAPQGVEDNGSPGTDREGMASAQAANRPTILNIRIKKVWAQALAAHNLDEEAFAKTAEISTYLGPISAAPLPSTVTWYNLEQGGFP